MSGGVATTLTGGSSRKDIGLKMGIKRASRRICRGSFSVYTTRITARLTPVRGKNVIRRTPLRVSSLLAQSGQRFVEAFTERRGRIGTKIPVKEGQGYFSDRAGSWPGDPVGLWWRVVRRTDSTSNAGGKG